MKKVLSILSAMVLLTACDISTPSEVSIGQIRLDQSMRTEVLDAAYADPARVNVIADDFERNGDGSLRTVISYQGTSPLNAIEAERQAAAYKKAFGARGVKNVDVSYVAVNDALDAGKAIISYSVLAALPPANCNVPMPGSAGADKVEDAMDYRIGCETKTALSRMVAEPRDLEGRGGTPDGDSRRQGAVSEKYRSGVPNEPIEGFGASEIGKSAGGG